MDNVVLYGEIVGVDACIDPRADASIRPYGHTVIETFP